MSTAPAQPFPIGHSHFPINTASSQPHFPTQPQHSLTPESPSNPVHRQSPPIGTASIPFPIIRSRSGTHSPTPYPLPILSYPLPTTSYPLPIPSYFPLHSPTFPHISYTFPSVPYPVLNTTDRAVCALVTWTPLNITEQVFPDLSANSSGQEPESLKPHSTCGVDCPVQWHISQPVCIYKQTNGEAFLLKLPASTSELDNVLVCDIVTHLPSRWYPHPHINGWANPWLHPLHESSRIWRLPTRHLQRGIQRWSLGSPSVDAQHLLCQIYSRW